MNPTITKEEIYNTILNSILDYYGRDEFCEDNYEDFLEIASMATTRLLDLK